MTPSRLRIVVSFGLAGALSGALPLAQADRVRTSGESVTGTVVGASQTEIRVETDQGIETIPLPEVRAILFTDEPAELAQARINVANQGYLTAQEKLADVVLQSGANPLIREELAYLRAECAARLAVAGRGDARIAGRDLVAFVKQHPTSHHYYPAVTTLGDLLLAMQRTDRAEQQYALLASAPWPAYRARSARLVGFARQQADDHRAAIEQFDKVLQMTGPGLASDHRAARLAKAESLAATDRLDEALHLVRTELTGDSPPLAAGYCALGRCYQQADRPTEALLAFLRVDYLYPEDPLLHAEALHHLATLWESEGDPVEAAKARTKLRRFYSASRWATP